MAISKFPDFSPIELIHKNEVDRILSQGKPQPSELTFADLFMWRMTRPVELSILDGALIIKENEPGAVQNYYPPIGPEDVVGQVKTLVGHMGGKEKLCIGAITEPLAGKLISEGFKIKEDRNNWDYIYQASDLAKLKGSKYSGRRKEINKFKRTYEHEYTPMTQKEVTQCLQLHEDWCDLKKCAESNHLTEEKCSIYQSLVNFSELDICGGVVYVDGVLSAFTIGEQVYDDTAIVHFEKANNKFSGISQYINMKYVSGFPEEVKWVNREQDLGEPGLREAKMRYHPHHFVEKYVLRLG